MVVVGTSTDYLLQVLFFEAHTEETHLVCPPPFVGYGSLKVKPTVVGCLSPLSSPSPPPDIIIIIVVVVTSTWFVLVRLCVMCFYSPQLDSVTPRVSSRIFVF